MVKDTHAIAENKYILYFCFRDIPTWRKEKAKDKASVVVAVVVAVVLVVEEEAVVLLVEDILHQLSLVAYPIIYRFLYISGGCIPYWQWGFSIAMLVYWRVADGWFDG